MTRKRWYSLDPYGKYRETEGIIDLTRKLSLALIDRYHDPDFEDCGTKHTIRYKIDSQRKLDQINGRHYYDYNEFGEQGTELKTVTKQNKELIGKEIALRSPVTCAGKDHVCATCYGKDLSEKNRKINTGLNAVFLLTNPLTQRLLSAKHLLTTNTDLINFGEDFNDAFNVNLDTVLFNDKSDYSISFVSPTEDDYDEDNEAYYINDLTLINNENHMQIKYTSPLPLLLNPIIKIKDSKDDNVIHIASKSYTGDYLFKFVAHNNELIKSLENILDLIESSGHLGISDYNEFINKFNDLLLENGIDVKSVHAEMIASVLIKDAVTGKRPDFSKDIINPYSIIRVSNSIMKGPLSKSLSFERLNDQLSDIETYKKNEKSNIDYMFK